MNGISGKVLLDDESTRFALPKGFQQPLSLGGLSICADARLDNQDALIEKLGLFRGHAKHEIRDTTNLDDLLILAAYRTWERDCVAHLLGDFAFVICDEARKRVFAARDPLGARPLYYCLQSNVLVFASRVLDAAAFPEVSPNLNRGKVAGFLVQGLGGAYPGQSWFMNLRRLRPAHFLSNDGKGFRETAYWKPNPDRELELDSDDAYCDAFEELLDRAVQDRLRGPGVTASMLSGGMDSSTIVGLASRHLAGRGEPPFHTYSGISDENDCIETVYADRVIAHCDVEATRIRPSDVHQYEVELRRVDAELSEPTDQAWSLLMLLFLRARADGRTCLLSGLDGDLVASLGPDYPAYLLRAGRVQTAIRELKGQHRNYFRCGQPTPADYFRVFRRAATPAFMRRTRLALTLPAVVREILGKSLVHDSLVEELDLVGRMRRRLRARGVDLSPTLRHSHALDIQVPNLSAAAELYGRLAASFNMECRHPLLDKRLVEFCVSLPWDQKCRNGWSKFGMRRVAGRVLPNEVAWRPGFEEISWKFTAERSRLNREEELDTAPGFARDFSGLVSVEKVDQRVSRLHRKELAYDMDLINFLALARWLNRLGIRRF